MNDKLKLEKMKEVIMDPNSISGIYKCTKCKNVEVHIQGEEFTPCSECNTNSWIVIERDN